MKKILFITGNKRKIWQAQTALEPFGIEVETRELEVVEIQAHDQDVDKAFDSMPTKEQEEKVTLGKAEDAVTLSDMRNSWRQLWVGMSVMTSRLARDSYRFRSNGLKELSAMDGEDRQVVMQTLFNQFQDINALRFGSKSAGVMWSKLEHDLEEGTVARKAYDPDLSEYPARLSERAARRKYNAVREERPAVHTAGKLSPRQMEELRREFSELDPDKFFFATGFRKDAFKALRGEESDEE